jgi:hypothetical protein
MTTIYETISRKTARKIGTVAARKLYKRRKYKQSSSKKPKRKTRKKIKGRSTDISKHAVHSVDDVYRASKTRSKSNDD